MKRAMQVLVTCILLGSLTLQADFAGWRASTFYENGEPILSSDVQTFQLYCNTTPDEFGPPYEVLFSPFDLASSLTPSQQTLVSGGVSGTYWCAPTQASTVYGSESRYGPEQDFTVTAQTMGFVPNPPVL